MIELTPEQWRDKLLVDLRGRRAVIDLNYRYYRGDHPLPWAPAEVGDAYRSFLKMARSNWCRLVVKAPSERLRPVGMRFSGGDATGDTETWETLWQGNRLDAECRMVHDSALIARRGFALVWPRGEGQTPSITPEHPSQVIVEFAPGDRRTRLAGLKTFDDVQSMQRFVTLWLPGAVYQWTAPLTTVTGVPLAWSGWNDEALNITEAADNPLGEVPLIEFVADPALVGEPMSELDGGVIDIQDRINKTILDRLVTSNFSSFPQKWATGLEIPTDPETKQPIEPFKNAVDRVFYNENPEGSFGSFEASDLAPYIKSVESDIQHLAAITRTPPHYLLGQSGAFPSGESLKSTETGLVAKVLERRDSFTESWEDVLRLALKAAGDPRSDDMAMSVLWKDPESRTQAEVMDAATKMQAVGVPYREILAFIGYSPTDISRLVEERKQDVADGLAPAAPAAAVPAA